MFVWAWSHGSSSYWRNKWHEQRVAACLAATPQHPAGSLRPGCWRSPGPGWRCWSRTVTGLRPLCGSWCLDAPHTPPPNLCRSPSWHSSPTCFLHTKQSTGYYHITRHDNDKSLNYGLTHGNSICLFIKPSWANSYLCSIFYGLFQLYGLKWETKLFLVPYCCVLFNFCMLPQ